MTDVQPGFHHRSCPVPFTVTEEILLGHGSGGKLTTRLIEETIVRLRSEIAIVIVTHNLQQAYRVADRVGFMYLGDLVEYDEADQVFGAPKAKRTREYVSGGFG